jgi:polyribonucleotide 5'-hydroxyl-kinase
MVVGERGSGKTTLIKTLVNWRVREMKAKGEKTGVLFVNLDVAEGGMTMPGTMSVTSMNSLLPTTTPVCSLGTTISSGPPVLANSTTSSTEDGINDWQPSPAIDALAPPVNSLIYWHGHTSPNLNPSLYDLLLKRVGKSVKRKLQEGGLEGWKAGVIVDTPGEWADKKGMGAVSKVVRELESEFMFLAVSRTKC